MMQIQIHETRIRMTETGKANMVNVKKLTLNDG